MSVIGRRLRRVEDERLITGRGRYADDIRAPDQAYLAVRRAHLPHALIRSVNVDGAAAVKGVLGAFTAADLPEKARFIFDVVPAELEGWGRPVLAADEVNYLGEAIAVVIADDPYAAADAAAAIEVELEPLPASGSIQAALAPQSALVHEHVASNIAFLGTDGFGDIAWAFGPEAVVVGDRLVMGRVCGAAIEPRSVIAVPHPDGLKVSSSTQAVFLVRNRIADYLGLEREKVVVLAEDVGGGFGPKGRMYPEEILVAWTALKLNRAVKWTATRSEDSITSTQAHGTVFDLELAADPDGTLRGLRGVIAHDLGAYPSIGAIVPSRIVEHMLCGYRMPAMRIDVQLIFTNATPTGTVRGGGGPEGNFAIERLMDSLAWRIGVEPAEIRRRNLIPPGAMPYEFRFGGNSIVLDCGDLSSLLSEARAHVEAVSPSDDGRLRGVGVAMGVEHTGKTFRGEPVRLRIGDEGVAQLFVGSTPSGQGHQTMCAQVVADRLGWPIDRVKVTAGDTRWLRNSGGTAGSRSAVTLGNAVSVAALAARAILLARAADILKVGAHELDLDDGVVVVRGSPTKRLDAVDALPPGGIDLTDAWATQTPGTTPSSCHIAEVAVDPETGAVDVVRYVVVHDSGRDINPMIVEGQFHGGIVHGIGYALFEEAIFTADGDFRTATWPDYSIPSISDIGFEPLIVSHGTEARNNPEGIKGVGEAGTIPAVAAIASAVEAAIVQVARDAVISEVPITAQRLRQLIAQSQGTAR